MIGRTKLNRVSFNPLRVGVISLFGALVVVLFNESPVWGAGTLAASTSGNATSGAGLLLAMGAGVLLLGIGGFTVLTLSRRRRAPQQCALEREALEVAEQAVRYWEGALAHLKNNAQSDNANAGRTPGETQASLLDKAESGHAKAVQARDERQLDLIRCMASGTSNVPLNNTAVSRLEPVRFDINRPTPPANSSE